ncbi:adenylate cyclase type 10-like isoform X1 [Apostichopus japonicus]
MRVTTVGNQECCHFVLGGEAVDDANRAEKFASSGSIILSPKIWAYSPDQDLITHEVLSDSRHIEVEDYLLEPPPDDPMEQVPDNTNHAWNALLEPSNKKRRRPKSPWRRFSNRLEPAVQKLNVPSSNELGPSPNEAEVIGAEDAKGRRRKTVFSSMTDDEKSRLRKYIIRPVLQKIDDGLHLEYLSEMRQVSVLFINLLFINGEDIDDVGSLQAAFQTIYRDLRKFEGCLNKIFMFDKGCTFLCMFGVPGYKHEDDCARALKCAYQISERLKNGPNVSQVSIGVTTGSSFCGVVGHVHRHEYTVIGRKVNMAARLMMHYPNKVSCDPETYHHSKLPRSFFRQLPHREMKGVRQAGVIHEYTEDENAPGQLVRTRSLLPYNEHTNVPEFEYPLLGREQEMDVFVQEMQQVIRNRNKRGKQRHVIVTQGEAGIGKSRFLDAAMSVADKLGMRVICLALSVNEASIPYYTVRALFTLLLKMETCVGHLERERVLLSHISEQKIREKLCLLNDLLILKFPPCARLLHLGSEELADELHHLLVQVVHKFAKDHCIVFTVDDAHFIDQYSWEFLNDLVEDSSTVCLLAIRPPSGDVAPPCPAAKKLISSRSTMHIKLKPLDGDHMAAMACQMLDVVRVPEELVSVLQEKCHGVPSWCEQILHDMLQTNAVELVSEDSPQVTSDSCNHIQPKMEELQKRHDSIGSQQGSRRGSIVSQLLHSKATETTESNVQDTTKVENETKEDLETNKDVPMVCILGKDVNLADLRIPDSMKGMILSRIDHLKPSEQLIVKCAAVLGMSFTRDMLKAIIPSSLKTDIAKFRNAIHLLTQVGIFECDSPSTGTEIKRFSAGISSHMTHGNKIQIRTECNCPKEEDKEEDEEDAVITGDGSDHTILISLCRNLKFTSTLLQETANGLLLADQKRKLHRRSAEYLEDHAHKCVACGGGQFIPSHTERQQTSVSLGSERSVKPSLFQQTARAKSAKTSTTSKELGKKTSLQTPDTPENTFEKEQPKLEMLTVTAGKKRGVVKFDVQSVSSSSTIGGSSIFMGMRNKLKNRRATSGTLITTAPDYTSDEESQSDDEEDLGPNDELEGDKRKSFINFRQNYVERTLSIISFEETTTENSTKQGLNFDELDFRECRCLEVLNTVFPQLVRHWRAAANTAKTIHFLVEAGGAAIAMGNNMQAMTFLREASHIIEQLDADQRPLPDDPNENITVATEDRGKIASMIGQSFFQMGQMEESLPYFLNALKILKNKQPSSNPGIYLKTLKEAFRQLMFRTLPNRGSWGAFTRKDARLLEQSRCLSHIWHLHNSQNWSLGALSAALQQVNRAEKVNSDLEELINAYINMMECCSAYGWMSLGHRYEKLAMMRCLERSAEVNFDNLVSIGRLYCVSMQTRLSKGHIQGAIDSGYSAYKIAEKLHDNSLELEVLPVLAHALMLAGRTTASVEVLEKLEYAGTEEEDVVALCSYYCNCMDLIFDAGHQLESFQRCLTFYQINGTNQAFITNSTCQRYLIVSFALWFYRREEWEAAERWLLAAESLQPEIRNSLRNVQAALKLAECYLLSYCRQLTTTGTRSRESKTAKRETRQYLRGIKSDVQSYPVTKLRYDLLQLYHSVLSKGTRNRRRITKQINRLRVSSEVCGDKLDSAWALACEKAWLDCGEPQGERKSSVQKSDIGFDKDGILPSRKSITSIRFTLPLPKTH